MKFKKLKHRTITMQPLFLILLIVGALCQPVPRLNILINETFEEIEKALKQLKEEKFSGPEKSSSDACELEYLNTYITLLEHNNIGKQSDAGKWTKPITGKLKKIHEVLKKSAHQNAAERHCDVKKEKTSFNEFSEKLQDFLKLLNENYGDQRI